MITKITTQFKTVIAILLAASVCAAQPQVGTQTSGGGGANTSVPSVGGESTNGSEGSGTVAAATLPVVSPDVLRIKSLSMVTNGSRSVYSETINWNYPGSHTHTNVYGRNAEDVLQKLFSAELRYQIANEDDPISGYVWLYDRYQNGIFNGYASFTASQLSQGHKPMYNIWMQPVPLLSNVEFAEILVLNEDGQTVDTIELDITREGQLEMMPWLAGAPNGVLVVRLRDGTLLRYDLADPAAETPEGSREASDFKIDGHYIFNRSCPVGYTCVSAMKIVEVWQRPTVYVNGNGGNMEVDVVGIVQNNAQVTQERPYAMTLVSVATGASFEVLLKEGPTTVAFPAGEWRGYFHWIEFGKPNRIYTGGKG